VTKKMAEGSLPFAPSDDSVSRMLEALSQERDAVGAIVKAEVEKLLHWGAEITEMTYFDASANTRRACLRPKNMRTSFLQDDGLLNLKRIHWIFHELPETLHRDVLMHRMSHMDVVTIKVMLQLNVVWGVKREGEETKRSNCIEKMYARILNEKKTTIVKPEKNRNRRMPFTRKPQTRARSGNPATFRPGMTEFYWKSMAEGEKVVNTRHGVISCWACCASLTGYFHLLQQVDYRQDMEWNTWNLAAKKRILLDDGSTRNYQKVMAPPMAEYCVSLRRVSGSATQVSSLGSSNTRFSLESSGETTVAMSSKVQEQQWDRREEENTPGTPMENETYTNETNYAQEASEVAMETTLDTEESDEVSQRREKLNSGKQMLTLQSSTTKKRRHSGDLRRTRC
jgi:hypothetical protein